MKRTIVTAFAVAMFGLLTLGATEASAAWYGSGWWPPTTWRNYALTSTNQATFAVSGPIAPNGISLSANITNNTWHWAATLCSNGVQTLGYPYGGFVQAATFGATVGGLVNQNTTGLCGGGTVLSYGGVYLWL
jgi:hypothetical protein